MELSGKVVALTGAASGIGRELAFELARQGCRLALSDVDEIGLKETASRIPPDIGICTHRVDVSDRDRVYRWADEVVKFHGHVDIIINNAGVASQCPIEDIEYSDFDWVFDIVFYGVLYGTKAFLPYLRLRPEAQIVNISSANAFFPFPSNGPYNCAKHAVKALNQTLMQELDGSTIGVTSVHPGGIKTNIARNSRLIKPMAGPQITNEDNAARFDRLAGTTADKAARIIVAGVRKRKQRLLVGKDAYVLDWLVRLFPQGFSNYIGRTFTSSARKAKARADARMGGPRRAA